MRRILRQPLPVRFAPQPFALDGGPFGAFERSRALSDDGRIVAVATPGHTPGHISVICIDDAGRHVMLAGDVTDTLEQLHARRADAVGPDPKAHVATLETILAHCARTRPCTCPRTTPSPVRGSPALSPSAERASRHDTRGAAAFANRRLREVGWRGQRARLGRLPPRRGTNTRRRRGSNETDPPTRCRMARAGVARHADARRRPVRVHAARRRAARLPQARVRAHARARARSRRRGTSNSSRGRCSARACR